jgi:hypothetical protein
MTVPVALRHWIEDAEARLAPDFDSWFPSGFDWRRLCADTPRFAQDLGEVWKAETAAAARARLADLAGAAFRGAYVAALSILAAYDAERDPDDALARLTAPLSDDESDAFEEAVARHLGPAEELLGEDVSREGSPPPAAREVATMLRPALPAIREVLAPGLQGAARALVSLGAGGTPSAKVLAGVVNVAVAVAGLRFLAAAAADDAAGGEPLRFDAGSLAAALAPA